MTSDELARQRDKALAHHEPNFRTHPGEVSQLLAQRRTAGVHLHIERDFGNLFSVNFRNILGEGPVGLTYRDVTPNYEQHRFVSVCDLLDLKPLIFENQRDKFVSLNRSKYLMAKMVFFEGYGKKGGMRTSNIKIIDFSKAEGKMLGAISTIAGKPFSQFHTRLFLGKYPQMQQRILDISHLTASRDARSVYEAMFTVAIAHGVVLENFLTEGREDDFTKNIVVPAFRAVRERTGFQPLVVPLEPTDIEGIDFWLYYPHDVQPRAKELLEFPDNESSMRA